MCVYRGESLYDLMAENKWKGAKKWAKKENSCVPYDWKSNSIKNH